MLFYKAIHMFIMFVVFNVTINLHASSLQVLYTEYLMDQKDSKILQAKNELKNNNYFFGDNVADAAELIAEYLIKKKKYSKDAIEMYQLCIKKSFYDDQIRQNIKQQYLNVCFNKPNSLKIWFETYKSDIDNDKEIKKLININLKKKFEVYFKAPFKIEFPKNVYIDLSKLVNFGTSKYEKLKTVIEKIKSLDNSIKNNQTHSEVKKLIGYIEQLSNIKVKVKTEIETRARLLDSYYNLYLQGKKDESFTKSCTSYKNALNALKQATYGQDTEDVACLKERACLNTEVDNIINSSPGYNDEIINYINKYDVLINNINKFKRSCSQKHKNWNFNFGNSIEELKTFYILIKDKNLKKLTDFINKCPDNLDALCRNGTAFIKKEKEKEKEKQKRKQDIVNIQKKQESILQNNIQAKQHDKKPNGNSNLKKDIELDSLNLQGKNDESFTKSCTSYTTASNALNKATYAQDTEEKKKQKRKQDIVNIQKKKESILLNNMQAKQEDKILIDTYNSYTKNTELNQLVINQNSCLNCGILRNIKEKKNKESQKDYSNARDKFNNRDYYSSFQEYLKVSGDKNINKLMNNNLTIQKRNNILNKFDSNDKDVLDMLSLIISIYPNKEPKWISEELSNKKNKYRWHFYYTDIQYNTKYNQEAFFSEKKSDEFYLNWLKKKDGKNPECLIKSIYYIYRAKIDIKPSCHDQRIDKKIKSLNNQIYKYYSDNVEYYSDNFENDTFHKFSIFDFKNIKNPNLIIQIAFYNKAIDLLKKDSDSNIKDFFNRLLNEDNISFDRAFDKILKNVEMLDNDKIKTNLEYYLYLGLAQKNGYSSEPNMELVKENLCIAFIKRPKKKSKINSIFQTIKQKNKWDTWECKHNNCVGYKKYKK